MTSRMRAQRSSRIGATQQPASHQPVAGSSSSSSSRRLTARRPAATRRLRAALQHLCPVTRSPQSAASTAQPPPAAAPATDIAAHLGRLDSDGVTIVKGVFSGARIAAFRSHLTAVWSSIQQSGLESLDWSPMRFKPHVLEDPCFCFGKALYEGKLTADYMGTDLTDILGKDTATDGAQAPGAVAQVGTDTFNEPCALNTSLKGNQHPCTYRNTPSSEPPVSLHTLLRGSSPSRLRNLLPCLYFFWFWVFVGSSAPRMS